MEKTNSPTESDAFEIGLVMAGAVSARAHTAGVIDYLLEVLQTRLRGFIIRAMITRICTRA